jgi:hypothetical protein
MKNNDKPSSILLRSQSQLGGRCSEAETRWEIRYWTDPDLSGSPRRESFDSPDEARARREEVISMGYPTHLRLFPSSR